jgi:hypothetical protein
MTDAAPNKYRTAIAVLQRGRDVLVESLAEDIVDQGDELVEGGYQFNELLETQGTRLHFLTLLIGQLEQSAEALEEATAPPPAPAKRPPRRRSRSKKLQQQSSKEGTTEDL